MIKIVDGIANALAKISIILSIIMVTMIILSVLMRYLVGMPLAFSDELAGLLFVATAFTIVPACELSNRNIAVTLVVDMLPSGLRAFFRLIGQSLVVVFALVFGYLSLEFALTSAKFDARMDSFNFSLVPWMMIIPVTMAVIAVVSFVRLFDRDPHGSTSEEE